MIVNFLLFTFLFKLIFNLLLLSVATKFGYFKALYVYKMGIK